MKTKIVNLNVEYPEFELLAECGKAISKGRLVVFPTDTVYGIAADSSNAGALKKLREVKKRSEDKPFAVLIRQLNHISQLTSSNNTALYKLIDKFWPGPLTVVVPDIEGKGTVGIRMPNDIIALRLIQEAQCVIAAPSANFEGNPEPETLKDALRDMDGLVDIAIDGGKTRIGKGSTVVSLLSAKPEILREGIISEQDINYTASRKTVLFVCTGNSCRSVMAEYYMRNFLEGREDVEVVSAGTSVFLSSIASQDAMAILREEGIDATHHLSRQVNSILLKKADLVFAMTRSHRAQMLSVVPELKDKIRLFRDPENSSSEFFGDVDVPDPMGMSKGAYKECFEIIKENVRKIVGLI